MCPPRKREREGKKCIELLHRTRRTHSHSQFKSILFTQIIFDISNACHSYGTRTHRRTGTSTHIVLDSGQLHTSNCWRRRLLCEKFRLIVMDMQSNSSEFCLANGKYKSGDVCVAASNCLRFLSRSLSSQLLLRLVCGFFLFTHFIHFMGLVSSNFNVLIITCHILMPIRREKASASFCH